MIMKRLGRRWQRWQWWWRRWWRWPEGLRCSCGGSDRCPQLAQGEDDVDDDDDDDGGGDDDIQGTCRPLLNPLHSDGQAWAWYDFRHNQAAGLIIKIIIIMMIILIMKITIVKLTSLKRSVMREMFGASFFLSSFIQAWPRNSLQLDFCQYFCISGVFFSSWSWPPSSPPWPSSWLTRS